MSAERYTIRLTCDREGCEDPAVLMAQALGSDETNLLCAACVTKIGQRLEAVQSDYDALIDNGVDQKMAQRIVSARLDRKEV